MDQAKNFAKATVFDGNYDASTTEIDVLSGEGARFPVAPFNAVWWNATDYPDPADDPEREIIRVTTIATDTLTITRAQEGTAANDKNLSGKIYKLIAGLTALAWNTLLGDVFGSGPAVLPEDTKIRIRGSSTCFIDVAESGAVSIQSESVGIGDVEGEGNFTSVNISDSLQLIAILGKIGTNQSASASTAVGTLAAKAPVYNESGTLLGYIPIYDSIT